MKPRCHWDGDAGWLSPEHQRDCDDGGCAGCRPCGEYHCALRGRCATHVSADAGLITCPSCIGRVRGDLDVLVDLYAVADQAVEERAESSLLLDELESGIESEAFNLTGPAAAPEQYAEHRRRLGLAYADRGWCDWPRHERFHEDDPHHPYAVLGRWDLALREQYGPQTDLFITVTSAADYLRGLLAGPFPHGDEFEDFAREIATCRAHLEVVVHNSRTPEQGRHCPRCVAEHGKGPKLRKRYAEHPDLKPGQRCVRPPRSTEEPDGCATCAGHDDTWHCPEVADHWWSEADYRTRVAGDFIQHAEWLTATDMQERTGVKAGTVRKWAHDGDVSKRLAEGRVVYRVADVKRRNTRALTNA